jgi:CheY-like chemotaxis protein
MSAKRALVVDDSKSARAFLHRLLDKHGLEVDTAESAEDALGYLAKQLPDVIFMDHLMPGMDGFQAVQAIKANPRTAGIPVMMYTSQQGELYLGQARALGAVGVLPKQIQPADVTKVLYQLQLIPERRGDAWTGYHGAERRRHDVAAETRQPALDITAELIPPPRLSEADLALQPDEPMLARAPAPPLPALALGGDAALPSAPLRASLPATDEPGLQSLRAELEAMRRQFDQALDQQSGRIAEEVARVQREQVLASPLPAAEPTAAGAGRDWLGVLYSLAATAAAIALGVLYFQGEVERRGMEIELARLREAVAALPQGDAAVPAEVGLAMPGTVTDVPPGEPLAAATAGPQVWPVPYGELPLAGARVERLKALLDQLLASGFEGVVEVQAFPARYCLKGSVQDGYVLAPEATPLNQCDLVGNAADGVPGAAPRESLAFANMLAEFRRTHGSRIEVRLATGPIDQVVRPYPDSQSGAAPLAGNWNAAAAANSRVEVRWFPRG